MLDQNRPHKIMKTYLIMIFGLIAIQAQGQNFKLPVLTDTVAVAMRQLETNVMLQGGFELLGIINEGNDLNLYQLKKVWDDYFNQYISFLNHLSDTENLNDSISDIPITEQPPPPAPAFPYKRGVRKGSGELNLFVDSSQTVSMPDYMDISANDLVNGKFDLETYLEVERDLLSKYYKPKEEQVKAFPLFIYNSTDSLVSLDTQEGWIYIIQEAKDEKGKWKPIEFWDYYTICGNSLNSKELLPGQVGISKIYSYKGDYHTQMRVKLLTNGLIYYSNEFQGTINKSQLKLPERLKVESNKNRNARFFKNDN